MLESRIQAVDALNSVRSNIKGIADALSAHASIEGDDLAAMLSTVADEQAEAIRSVREWLESDIGAARLPE